MAPFGLRAESYLESRCSRRSKVPYLAVLGRHLRQLRYEYCQLLTAVGSLVTVANIIPSGQVLRPDSMGKKKKQQVSQAEIWDDSALIRSWDDALAEYKVRLPAMAYSKRRFAEEAHSYITVSMLAANESKMFSET